MDVVRLFRQAGHRHDGEAISPLGHALQCAALARQDRADDEVVLAAPLHDIGHLAPCAIESPYAHHGTCGAALLRPSVPERVAWLVEHHVIAKRYLCTVNPRYTGRLSPASVRSLAAQGAVLDLEQRLALETQPWFGDALRIRHWDDEAKVVDAVTPPLVAYRPLIERWLGPQSWTAGPESD